ncbi:MAG: hypothetical protein AAGL69_07145 [Pseudomonadota bacterium]
MSIRVLVLFVLTGLSAKAFCGQTLLTFEMSDVSLESDGSVVCIAEAHSDVEEGTCLVLESWVYDVSTKEYLYSCLVRLETGFVSVPQVSRKTVGEWTTSRYAKNGLSLLLRTKQSGSFDGESYGIVGELVLQQNNVKELLKVVGWVWV